MRTARQRFAASGYEATSLRAIAAGAGVDPGVVVHFFGTKERLFREVVGWPFDPEQVAARIAVPDDATEGMGARVARIFLGYWDDPTMREALTAVLRSAMTNEQAAALLREFVMSQVFAHISNLVAGPHAALRADLAASQLIGMALLRYVLRVEPLASASSDELIAWLAPVLSRYLDSEPIEQPVIS